MKAKNFFRASRGLIGATRLCTIPGLPLHNILYPPLFSLEGDNAILDVSHFGLVKFHLVR